MGAITLDRELVRRYATSGPRYTSYPTAPNFSEAFGPEQYAEALVEPGAGGRPLSLYFHIPFCRNLCYFCACSVVHTRRREAVGPYLDRLEREMDLVAGRLAPERRVVQLHWGGGTPTYLEPDDVARLMAATRERFGFADDAEVSMELDPRGVDGARLDAIAGAGFNRASLGLQDVDPEVQRAINRVQPLELTRAVIEGLRQRGIASVNLDLIYGLPHQSAERFGRTLEAVLGLRPERIALFNFAYLPRLKPHQRAIDPDALPGPEEKLAIFAEAVHTLTGAGYRYIGLDHFALPTDELCRAQQDGTLHRNFQGYSTRGGVDLLGLGVTSIGEAGRTYAQNAKDLADYQGAIDGGRLATVRGAVLTDDDLLRRHVIMELLCHYRLHKPALGARFGIDFDETFAREREALAPFAADGLVEDTPEALWVRPPGRFVIRNICMVFDAYLERNLASGQRFSKTV